MKILCISFFAFFALVEVPLIGGLLPPSIKVCRLNEPNISDCIVKAIDAISQQLTTGDLGGGFLVPPTDPFYIKQISFGDEKRLKVETTDVSVRGATRYKIEKLRANPNDVRFDVIVAFPQLDTKGKYKMTMHFLNAPVTSMGEMSLTFIDAKIKASIKGKKYPKNGATHIKFDPIDIKFSRGAVKNFHATNLFNGNKVLTEIVESLILNNPDFILKNFYAPLQSQLSRLFTDIANKIVEYSTFEELFPV